MKSRQPRRKKMTARKPMLRSRNSKKRQLARLLSQRSAWKPMLSSESKMKWPVRMQRTSEGISRGRYLKK